MMQKSTPQPPQMRRPVSFALSLVCVDLTRLDVSLRRMVDLGIERAHVDLIDLSFGNLGLAPETVSDLRIRWDVPIDVHLMVDKPADLIPDLVKRGANSLTVHQRCVTPPVVECLLRARDSGCGIGIAIEPGETIFEPLITRLRPEKLTVMTVRPGGAGRSFQPGALATLQRARGLQTEGLIGVLEADGAIGPDTADMVLEHGARSLVLGSTVFPRRDMQDHRMDELVDLVVMHDEWSRGKCPQSSQ